MFVKLGSYVARPREEAKGPDVVISLLQGLPTYVQLTGGKDDIEESAASVNCAVSICEVNNKPQQV